MDNLNNYTIHLHEDKGDKFTLVFDCWAEDEDHAEDQALDMYPNAEVVSIFINGNA